MEWPRCNATYERKIKFLQVPIYYTITQTVLLLSLAKTTPFERKLISLQLICLLITRDHRLLTSPIRIPTTRLRFGSHIHIVKVLYMA